MVLPDESGAGGSPACRTVAIPFTTPLLCGTKARSVERERIELLVPNPAGGQSRYVIALGLLRDFCQLSLHDELLLQQLMEIPFLAPATVRQAIRNVAVTGAAGQAVAVAARRAAAEDTESAEMATFMLIVCLLKQAGISISDLVGAAGDDRQARDRLRHKLSGLAPQFKLSVEDLFSRVQEIGLQASMVGMAESQSGSRHQHTLEELGEFVEHLNHWSVPETGEIYDLANRISVAARNAVAAGETTIERCRSALVDVATLVSGWGGDNQSYREQFAECDWLLDGWREVCALWRTVAAEERPVQREVVVTLERLAPIPREEEGRRRIETKRQQEDAGKRRWVRLNEDWRTGIVAAGMQARAESVLAVSL